LRGTGIAGIDGEGVGANGAAVLHLDADIIVVPRRRPQPAGRGTPIAPPDGRRKANDRLRSTGFPGLQAGRHMTELLTEHTDDDGLRNQTLHLH